MVAAEEVEVEGMAGGMVEGMVEGMALSNVAARRDLQRQTRPSDHGAAAARYNSRYLGRPRFRQMPHQLRCSF